MILFDKDFVLLISCWGTLGEFGRLCSCIGKTCLDPWIFYDIFFVIFYEVTAYLQWLHLCVFKEVKKINQKYAKHTPKSNQNFTEYKTTLGLHLPSDLLNFNTTP